MTHIERAIIWPCLTLGHAKEVSTDISQAAVKFGPESNGSDMLNSDHFDVNDQHLANTTNKPAAFCELREDVYNLQVQVIRNSYIFCAQK